MPSRWFQCCRWYLLPLSLLLRRFSRRSRGFRNRRRVRLVTLGRFKCTEGRLPIRGCIHRSTMRFWIPSIYRGNRTLCNVRRFTIRLLYLGLRCGPELLIGRCLRLPRRHSRDLLRLRRTFLLGRFNSRHISVSLHRSASSRFWRTRRTNLMGNTR